MSEASDHYHEMFGRTFEEHQRSWERIKAVNGCKETASPTAKPNYLLPAIDALPEQTRHEVMEEVHRESGRKDAADELYRAAADVWVEALAMNVYWSLRSFPQLEKALRAYREMAGERGD